MHRRTPRRRLPLQVEALVGLEVEAQVQVEARVLGKDLVGSAWARDRQRLRLRYAEARVGVVARRVVVGVDGGRRRVVQGKARSGGLEEGGGESGVGVDGRVGPGDSHALAFVFHAAVLEPDLEQGKERACLE